MTRHHKLRQLFVLTTLVGFTHGLEWRVGDSRDVVSVFGYDNPFEGVIDNAVDDVRFDKGPPPHQEAARMARYIMHSSNWASLATISTRKEIAGSPFANVFSVSDGATMHESSGIPYMYLTPMEMSVKDLTSDNRASMTMSLAQGQYCKKKDLDPEDPRCAHVILTGNVVKVDPGSREESFARRALFERHSDMEGWPKDHGWFFGKLNISSVLVLDYFGGAKDVSVDDYFKASPN